MTMGRKDLVEIKRRLLQVRAANPSRVTDDRVAPPIDLVVFPVISFPALGRPALMMRSQLTYPSPPSIQTQLAGPNQEEYWNLVSAFLHKQASKDELAEKVPRLLGELILRRLLV